MSRRKLFVLGALAVSTLVWIALVTQPPEGEKGNELKDLSESPKGLLFRGSNDDLTPIPARVGDTRSAYPFTPQTQVQTSPDGHLPELAAPSPLAAIVTYREELAYSGADAELRFHRFVDTLRADRESSADYLHRQLDGFSTAEKLGDPGRRIAFLLGHIGHQSSIPHLSSLIEMEHDEHEAGAGCSEGQSPSVTKSFAAHALDMIATRYHSPDTVLPVAELLEDVLKDRDQSPHLKVSAAKILLSHAENPAARARQLAEWMGDDAYLLEIDLVAHSTEVAP